MIFGDRIITNTMDSEIMTAVFMKRLFDEVWSMKNNKRTPQQINASLSSQFGEDPLYNILIQIADRTQQCKEIVDRFTRGKDIEHSTEVKADKKTVVLLNQIPAMEQYIAIIAAIKLPMDRNNLGVVVLNNKVNFMVTDINSIINDPGVLDRLFEHKITEEMLKCHECGNVSKKHGMMSVYKKTASSNEQLCEECFSSHNKNN